MIPDDMLKHHVRAWVPQNGTLGVHRGPSSGIQRIQLGDTEEGCILSSTSWEFCGCSLTERLPHSSLSKHTPNQVPVRFMGAQVSFPGNPTSGWVIFLAAVAVIRDSLGWVLGRVKAIRRWNTRHAVAGHARTLWCRLLMQLRSSQI